MSGSLFPRWVEMVFDVLIWISNLFSRKKN